MLLAKVIINYIDKDWLLLEVFYIKYLFNNRWHLSLVLKSIKLMTGKMSHFIILLKES